MRACLLTGVRELELRDLPRPQPGPRDVLLEVAAVGVCGTDFHIVSGEANYNLDAEGRPVPLERAPQLLGHEFCGTVRDVGDAVRDLVPGDRVVVDQGINCTSAARETPCEYCASGDSHQCEHYLEHGITGLPGAFAEFVAVPAVNCVKLADSLAFEEAALTEPLACVLHSSERAARANTRYAIGADDPARRVRTAVVLGAGPAGLLFVQHLLRVAGFDGTVVVSDPNPQKRALAESFGAVAVDPDAEDVVAFVREATGGRLAEYLVEATGSGTVWELLPQLVRKQATVLQYGVGHGAAPLGHLNQVQWKEPTLMLSVGATGGFDADGRPTIYRRAARLFEEGRVEAGPLLTHRYEGLDAVPAALLGAGGEAGYVKGVVVL